VVVTQVRDQGSKVAEGEGGGLAENAGIELTVEALVGVDIQSGTFAIVVGAYGFCKNASRVVSADTEGGARLQCIDAVNLPPADGEVDRFGHAGAELTAAADGEFIDATVDETVGNVDAGHSAAGADAIAVLVAGAIIHCFGLGVAAFKYDSLLKALAEGDLEGVVIGSCAL